ncbi:MAG: hypothetical protein JW919_00500 [Candidatus Omnitrophica bacterium]|nr:hypothetical protein [Candidatus Omnitrophota bacterium]
MKNKNIIIAAVIAVVLVAGVILISRQASVKKVAKAPARAAAVKKKAPSAPAKPVISKGKGALTVKITDSKNRDAVRRIQAFKVAGGRSSIRVATLMSNRMQELQPGSYDLEIEMVPAVIYKGVTVDAGKETVENIGQMTGALKLSALNAQKKEANYPVRVLYPNSTYIVTALSTNKREVEILPGVYDIEVGTAPRLVKKGVKVESGKETFLELGCMTGSLVVRAVDETNKDVRYGVRIKNSEAGEKAVSAATNKPVEILEGSYTVEVAAAPVQTQKDVKVKAGEETKILFVVKKPEIPKKPAATKEPAAVQKTPQAR